MAVALASPPLGPFLFGATDKLTVWLDDLDQMALIVVPRLRNMTAIDGTGLKAIQDFADRLRGSGRTLLLCGALPQPSALMNRAECHRHVGSENILPHVEAALVRADEVWRARGRYPA